MSFTFIRKGDIFSIFFLNTMLDDFCVAGADDALKIVDLERELYFC